jgi:hypothetical protein
MLLALADRPASRPAARRVDGGRLAQCTAGSTRAPFQTDDGETVLLHYTGLVQLTDIFKQAAEANKPTELSDQYMRLTMRFDTGAERCRWLNTSLFVGAVYLGLVVSNTPSTASCEAYHLFSR